MNDEGIKSIIDKLIITEAEKLKAKEGFIFETSIKSGKDNVYLVNKLFSYLKYVT